jgi:hypothetical protein
MKNFHNLGSLSLNNRSFIKSESGKGRFGLFNALYIRRGTLVASSRRTLFLRQQLNLRHPISSASSEHRFWALIFYQISSAPFASSAVSAFWVAGGRYAEPPWWILCHPVKYPCGHL